MSDYMFYNDNNYEYMTPIQLSFDLQNLLKEIFNEKYKFIKIIKYINKFWLNAIDVLYILNYENNFDISNIINDVHSNFKIYINSEQNINNDIHNIYINEEGLFELLLRTNTHMTESFRLFVYNNLFKNLSRYTMTYNIYNFNYLVNKINNLENDYKKMKTLLENQNIILNNIYNMLK